MPARDGNRSNWGWESYQIQTDQFGFNAIDWVLRSRHRREKGQSDSTGKMSDIASSESDPTGTDDVGSRSTLRCLHVTGGNVSRRIVPWFTLFSLQHLPSQIIV
jgi:hypothetical protein